MSGKEQLRTFNEWLESYKGVLFKIVRAYAFSAADREDLFQEISIQLWDSIPNYRKASSVSTWIYRVALYVALAWVRREKKHRQGKVALSSQHHILEETENARNPQLNWLFQQIGQLNEVDRSLTLLLLEGFSYKEMSNILGISESNVGVKIHRIKKQLSQKAKKF